MELPTPTQTPDEQYREALKLIHKAQWYITMTLGEEAGLDYMIGECKKLASDGKLSDHCYEYASKSTSDLTDEQIEQILPKNEDGKAIWSYKDM